MGQSDRDLTVPCRTAAEPRRSQRIANGASCSAVRTEPGLRRSPDELAEHWRNSSRPYSSAHPALRSLPKSRARDERFFPQSSACASLWSSRLPSRLRSVQSSTKASSLSLSMCRPTWASTCSKPNQKLSILSSRRVSPITGLSSPSRSATPSRYVLGKCLSITSGMPCLASNSFASCGPSSDQLSLATFVRKSTVTVPRS